MSEFVVYLEEVFEQFGHIYARKMFGGYGIYYEGVMFALVAEDTLYLKADESNAVYFKSRGLGQFGYDKGGKTVKMYYYRAPDEIFDSPEDATLWAKRAYEVAIRANRTGRK